MERLTALCAYDACSQLLVQGLTGLEQDLTPLHNFVQLEFEQLQELLVVQQLHVELAGFPSMSGFRV